MHTVLISLCCLQWLVRLKKTRLVDAKKLVNEIIPSRFILVLLNCFPFFNVSHFYYSSNFQKFSFNFIQICFCCDYILNEYLLFISIWLLKNTSN